MKKLLIISAAVVLSSATAFAGTVNNFSVYQRGAFNDSVLVQGGQDARNNAVVKQIGVGNAVGIAQGGRSSKNQASTLQLGFGNGAVIIQD